MHPSYVLLAVAIAMCVLFVAVLWAASEVAKIPPPTPMRNRRRRTVPVVHDRRSQGSRAIDPMNLDVLLP